MAAKAVVLPAPGAPSRIVIWAPLVAARTASACSSLSPCFRINLATIAGDGALEIS
ncbi:hypothetical protein ACVW1A_004833 [Bradyrhizobium sp. LB1.3]